MWPFKKESPALTTIQAQIALQHEMLKQIGSIVEMHTKRMDIQAKMIDNLKDQLLILASHTFKEEKPQLSRVDPT